MEQARLRLGELLVDARILTREQLDGVLEAQKSDGRRLGTLLVERGLVNETQLTQILSQQLSVPWVSLYHVDFSKRLLNMVPGDVARKYCLVPIYVRHVRGQGDTLYVAMDDPTNLDALRECAAWSGLPTRSMIASPSDIRQAIEIYYGPDPDAPQATHDSGPPTRLEGAVARAELIRADTPREELVSQPPAPQELPTQDATAHQVLEDEPPCEEPIASGHEASEGTYDGEAPPSSREPLGSDTQAEEETGVAEQVGNDESHEVDVEHDVAPAVDRLRPADSDEEVTVEVGEELSLSEVLAKREPTEADSPAGQIRRSKSGKILSLTLLDGTTLALPVSKRRRTGSVARSLQTQGSPEPQQPNETTSSESAKADRAHELLAAIRTAATTADAPGSRWEKLAAAMLAVLLRKQLITEEELLEELRRF